MTETRTPAPAVLPAPRLIERPRTFGPLGWALAGLTAVLTGLAFFIDRPVAAWALSGPSHLRVDTQHELMMLEQYGQWVSSVLILLLVWVLDKKEGGKKALGIAIGCLATVVVSYALKDLFGRTRPGVLPDGMWKFMGPGLRPAGEQSFPSAHTTGAFALSAGLAFYYPRGRWFFWALALQTAVQRVVHHAHYPSDVLAGALVAVVTARFTLVRDWAGRVGG